MSTYEDTSGDSETDGTNRDERTATDGQSAEATSAASATASTADADAEDVDVVDAELAESTGPELFVEDISLSYGDDDPVVDAETVVVPEGEVTALVGPNGSGKSTLLRAMSAEMKPDRGSVLLDGDDVQSFDTKALAKELGMLSQENTAPSSTTVRDLAMHGRYPHRGFFERTSEEDERAVERAIERVGVTHLADRPVGDLSGGQKQLAWLAMVLAQETDVLLLDEPTTYLDLHHQLRVLDAVRELNEARGVTVAVVLHDIGQAARFADNLVALRDGEPYDWGPPDEVVTDDLLRDVFGVEADVGFGPDGPTVTPRRALDEADGDARGDDD